MTESERTGGRSQQWWPDVAARRAGGAVVLLSGGIDSAVNLAEAMRRGGKVVTLTFDYGQRTKDRELIAARSIADYYGVPHKVIELGWFGELLPPTVMSGKDGERVPTHISRGADAALWIPNRNCVFVAIAAAYAEAINVPYVVAGFNVDAAKEFPDNSQEFIDTMNSCLKYATKSGVEVVAFTGALTKAEIIKVAVELDVPLERTYSCYEDGEKMCGVCIKCQRVITALNGAGVLYQYVDMFDL